MSKNPDFSQSVRSILAKRAGEHCSNPDCRMSTSGPHLDQSKAINLGVAAHIRAARKDQARYDLKMTDEGRSDISNGIWLCQTCAKLIDNDENKYSVQLLMKWKEDHEKWILEKKNEKIGREIKVKNGGIGSIIKNKGPGVALEIEHHGKGPAERIEVEGAGIGEIVTNIGTGVGKKIESYASTASETHVIVDKPVKIATGMIAKIVVTHCNVCGKQVELQKVVQGFAGNEEPKILTECTHCGNPIWI